MKSKLLLLLAFAIFFIPPSVFAGCTFSVNGAASTVTSSCSFDNNIDGLDAGPGDGTSTTNTGELKIAGGTLTILATQEIVLGKLTLTGGSLAIIDGGKLSIGKTLWYIDKDRDSYVTSLTPMLSASMPTGGIRKSFLTPLGIDCNDDDQAGQGIAVPHVFIAHTQCYVDADGDTYTNGLAANTTCLNTGSCATATRASLASNGATSSPYTAGRLANAANGTDCGDSTSNANNVYAHSGATAYYSVPFLNNSGVSNYDYDCSSGGTAAGEVKDPSQPIYVCNVTGCATHVFTISNGFAAATACGATGTWNVYAGAVAGTCTTTVAGAGTTCPAVTTSSVAQKCH